MTTRRLGAAAIIVASLMAGAACQGGGDDFDPDAEGYLELACSIHDGQRNLPFVEINEDDAEEQLAYAASTAVLEVGNRKRDDDLQDLSVELKVALDQDDAKAFDDAIGRLGDTCEDVDDDLSMEPEGLADVACAIAEVLESGPGPEVLLAAELLNAAASDDGGLGKYDLLSSAAGRAAIDPSEAAITDFREECASFD